MDIIPDFLFNINPRLDVKDVFITTEEISIDESVFRPGHIAIIENMLNAETQRWEAEVARLKAEFAETLENEKKNSYQEGNAAGIIQTREEMLSIVNTTKEELEKSIAALSFQTDAFLEYHENEILKLIIAIARKVIDVEVSLNPEIILTTLRRSLEYLNEKEEIKIVVNPSDWSIVKENLQKLSLTINMPPSIEIVANEEIESGGCRLDFKAGSIDAELETQFVEVKRKLLKEL